MTQPNPEESARVLFFAVLLVIVLLVVGLAIAGLFAEPWAIP